MSEIPGHMSPPYSEAARDDALFHYTSADGLIGILQNKDLWSTAYYCTNDEAELAAGKGILTRIFTRATLKMIQGNDPLVERFRAHHQDILEYSRRFEPIMISYMFNQLCTYITCFCRPTRKEDFTHGLLSQWRGYGVDGGYALQFSRAKLEVGIEKANKERGLNYDLQDVHYTDDNPLKSRVLDHAESFRKAYRVYLEEAGDLERILRKRSISDPVAPLLEGPLQNLLDYLIYTKNLHFREENECRLSLIESVLSKSEVIPTHYFKRGGLIVPYKKTPPENFPVLDSIEWIVIGPNARMRTRFRSVTQMVRTAGLAIKVRPSHIPFARD